MNEQEQFLKDLDIKTDTVLDTPLTEAEPEKESAEEDEVKLKNRRERRLAEK
jgi:hypothetical protein